MQPWYISTYIYVSWDPAHTRYILADTRLYVLKPKHFFIVVLIPKPFLKFPDKLIGKGCPTTGVLSMWNEKQRIDSG